MAQEGEASGSNERSGQQFKQHMFGKPGNVVGNLRELAIANCGIQSRCRRAEGFEQYVVTTTITRHALHGLEERCSKATIAPRFFNPKQVDEHAPLNDTTHDASDDHPILSNETGDWCRLGAIDLRKRMSSHALRDEG